MRDLPDKPWHELTKEDIGLRPLRDDERESDLIDYLGRPTGRIIARRCSQTIHVGRGSYPCGKDAKWAQDEGRFGKKQFFCPGHAGGELRSAKVRLRHDQEDAAAKNAEAVARGRLSAAAEVLGLDDPDLDYSWSAREYSTTHVVVALADLERLADQHADCVPMEQA